MASLTIEVGTLSASVTASNTKASEVLNAYADAIGATGTNQQRANAVIASLVKHMREAARRQVANDTVAAALSSAQTEINDLDWI